MIWYRIAIEGKTGKTSNMAAVEADAPYRLLLSCLAQTFGNSWQHPCDKELSKELSRNWVNG
jgi:hypothetical protein